MLCRSLAQTLLICSNASSSKTTALTTGRSHALQVSHWRLSTSAIASVAHVEAHGLLLVGCQSSEVRCCMSQHQDASYRTCMLTASSCMLHTQLQLQSALAAAAARPASSNVHKRLQRPSTPTAVRSVELPSARTARLSLFAAFYMLNGCGGVQVSLWTFQGGLVGMFGIHTWNITDRSTWQDPEVSDGTICTSSLSAYCRCQASAAAPAAAPDHSKERSQRRASPGLAALTRLSYRVIRFQAPLLLLLTCSVS